MVWLRGDCHVHSTRSVGGELSPEQMAAEARAAGLDFIAVTEHNTADTRAGHSRLTSSPAISLGLTASATEDSAGPGERLEVRHRSGAMAAPEAPPIWSGADVSG